MAEKKGKTEKTDPSESAPRWSWKTYLVSIFVIFASIVGFGLWSTWQKGETPPAKTTASDKPAEKSAATQPERQKPNLEPTGITLQPGEKLLATKETSSPPVALVIQFPDGEKRNLAASFWKKDRLLFSHIGQLAQRPIEVFYRGEKGKYQFEKMPPADSRATPATYRPSPARQQTSEVAPDKKEDCPFN